MLQKFRLHGSVSYSASNFPLVFAVSAALALMLPMGALAQTGAAITGRVTDSATGQALSGAHISLPGTTHGTVSHADGSFRLPVAAGRHAVLVSFVGYGPARDTVDVRAGETVVRNYALMHAVAQLDPSVVIGTRTTDRTVLSSPVPVDVLTPAEIRETGQVETSQIIQMLAPSFNFPRPSVTDGTDHVRPSTLRGLGPDQVLVLVNGKRRHTSALVNLNGSVGRGSTGVDLNAIPASSIERIEILRDGAAAQYGSDAIAGVINIILRSDDQPSATTQYGQTRVGDGDAFESDANWGKTFGDGGFLHLGAEQRHRGSTNRSRIDTRQQYFTGDPRNNDPTKRNLQNHIYGDALTNDIGAMFNAATSRFANGAQVYTFGGYSHREGKSAGFFRRALDDRTIRAFYPDGFLPFITSKIGDASGAVGVRGDAKGWNYDLSTLYGMNNFGFGVTHSANVSMGLASPRQFDAGSLGFNEWTTNLDLVRSFPIAPLSSPLNVAIGAEGRRDGYDINRGDSASYINGGVRILDGPNAGKLAAVGAQVFPGFSPRDEVNASRTNIAGYVDLEANLLPSVLVGAAGRTEHYSDFGNTTTGKFTARVEPIRHYALRGAISTGFRAPSLGQEYFSSTATNFIGGVPYEIRTFPVGSDLAKVLGAKPLRPEKSVNMSVGLAFQPMDNFSFTVDHYDIKITGRVVLSGNFIGDSVRALFIRSGFAGVAGGRFFTNAIDTHTKGTDVVARYAYSLDEYGLFRFTAGYNATRTRVVHVDSTPPQLKGQQEVLFDRVERGRIEVGQPDHNLNMTFDYKVKNVDLVYHTARFGQVSVRGTTPKGDQTFSPRWLSDVNGTIDLTSRVHFTAGANNLFDTYPDEQISANNNAGIFPYSSFSPFGFNGRFTFVKLAYGL